MDYNFTAIIAAFDIPHGEFIIAPFGSGHINDTFLVKRKTGDRPYYLLQKINHFVFRDIEGLMNNMVCVTNHLKRKVANSNNSDPNKEVLTLLAGNDGKYYHKDVQGNHWRLTYFLEDTRSYDVVTTEKQAHQGGVAFGRFQRLLSDLDPAEIVDVIPNFLNIEKRLEDFNTAIGDDKAERLKLVSHEVDYLRSWSGVMGNILNLGRAGLLPLRITHNDTKFNNILLDKNNNIQCVIDLDTVMPGYVAYDFGDAIRSIINTAAEDEANPEAIRLNIPLFAAFTKGYLGETHSFLTAYELKSLISGVLLLPYMQSVRFLTDYLNGDVYYKIHFPEHNLQRTRAQMQLFKLLELNRDKLSEIVNAEWAVLKSSPKVEK